MAGLKKVKWSAHAFAQFEKAYFFLFEFNETYAEKVRLQMFRKIEAVAKNPESFSLEKYKANNDGSYRYFELHHIRVSYRVKAEEIQIVRVRHTKMNPEIF